MSKNIYFEIQKAMFSAWEYDHKEVVSRGRLDDAYELGFIAAWHAGKGFERPVFLKDWENGGHTEDHLISDCRKAFDEWYDWKINSNPAYYNGFDYTTAFLAWQAAWNSRQPKRETSAQQPAAPAGDDARRLLIEIMRIADEIRISPTWTRATSDRAIEIYKHAKAAIAAMPKHPPEMEGRAIIYDAVSAMPDETLLIRQLEYALWQMRRAGRKQGWQEKYKTEMDLANAALSASEARLKELEKTNG